MRRFVMRAHGMEEFDDGGWVMYEDARELEAENKRLREALEEMLETVYWMSGSSDFSPEGQAHAGWVKVQPKIEKARQALEGGGEL